MAYYASGRDDMRSIVIYVLVAVCGVFRKTVHRFNCLTKMAVLIIAANQYVWALGKYCVTSQEENISSSIVLCLSTNPVRFCAEIRVIQVSFQK